MIDNQSPEELQQRLKALAKQNRLLQKQLERSEANRAELENSYERQSKFVGEVIQGLEKSRVEAEVRNQKLQEAFDDLQVMQAKLVQSEKMSALGVLIAGIAHEINNPISFIHANIEHAHAYVQNLMTILHLYQEVYPQPDSRIINLAKKLELDFITEDLFKILKSMQLGSDRIRQIVSGLRTFSRLDEAEYKKADLHDGLESTLLLLRHRLQAYGDHPEILISKRYGQIPEVLCFSGQLNQVFMNILVNAIDAVEELYAKRAQSENEKNSGEIRISTAIADSKWVKITIADNGIGMPEAVQQKIFNPFFTTKPVGKGTGMGMSICYQIVIEKHRGKLELDSKVGEGTQFTIQIPIQ